MLWYNSLLFSSSFWRIRKSAAKILKIMHIYKQKLIFLKKDRFYLSLEILTLTTNCQSRVHYGFITGLYYVITMRLLCDCATY